MVTEKGVASVLRALANERRLQILELLANGPVTVGDVAAHFQVSRPAISRHVRLLRESGLVVEQRLGRQRWLMRQQGQLEVAAKWLQAEASRLIPVDLPSAHLIGARVRPSRDRQQESRLSSSRPRSTRGRAGRVRQPEPKSRSASSGADSGSSDPWKAW